MFLIFSSSPILPKYLDLVIYLCLNYVLSSMCQVPTLLAIPLPFHVTMWVSPPFWFSGAWGRINDAVP